MALDFENYEPALMYGNAVINGDNVTPATLPASASTLKATYSTIANGLTSTTVVPVFGSTAPVAGTVTGFFVSSAGTAGSAVLWGTTAGTIAVINISATAGTVSGTTVLNAAVAAGDTFQVYTILSAGSGTCFTTFLTVN